MPRPQVASGAATSLYLAEQQQQLFAVVQLHGSQLQESQEQVVVLTFAGFSFLGPVLTFCFTGFLFIVCSFFEGSSVEESALFNSANA
jgi:hypothetical protein